LTIRNFTIEYFIFINVIFFGKFSNNIFTIEWYWEDDDPRDVIVGMAEGTQYYTLNLAINAREYVEQ
jgi:hypothetical protein